MARHDPHRPEERRPAREQKRSLRAIETPPNIRDQTIGRLLFYSGPRVSELVALDVEDVPLSARKGTPCSKPPAGPTNHRSTNHRSTDRQARAADRVTSETWTGCVWTSRRTPSAATHACHTFDDNPSDPVAMTPAPQPSTARARSGAQSHRHSRPFDHQLVPEPADKRCRFLRHSQRTGKRGGPYGGGAARFMH